MKYFSEVTNKHYDSAEDCIAAEKEFAEAEARKKEAANAVSKEKKEFAKAIENAEIEVDKACEAYNNAKTKAAEIIANAEEEASKLLDEARKKVKEATNNKYEAVAEFNKKFGPYVTHYNDDRALKELRRATSWVNDIFNGFLW